MSYGYTTGWGHGAGDGSHGYGYGYGGYGHGVDTGDALGYGYGTGWDDEALREYIERIAQVRDFSGKSRDLRPYEPPPRSPIVRAENQDGGTQNAIEHQR